MAPVALVTAAVTAGAGLLLRRLFRGGRHNEPPAPPGPPPPEYVQEYRRATRMVNTHLRLGAYLLLLAAIVIASFKHVWEIAVLELLLGLMLLTEEWRALPPGTLNPANAPAKVILSTAPAAAMSGTWIKDAARSTPMEAACQMMQLNRIMRTAICLIRGMDLTISPQEFSMSIFSIVPWFRVNERYPLSGETRQCKRRDMRRGLHTAYIQALPDGGLRLNVSWGEPMGGRGADVFRLTAPDELTVSSTITTQHGTCEYTQVYRRKPGRSAAEPGAESGEHPHLD